MTSFLRETARRAVSAVQSAQRHQWQQRRFAGDLPAKTNKYVEDMAYHRENIERDFKWDRRTLTNILVFAGVVPFCIYTYW